MLVGLYGHRLRVDVDSPKAADRDRFIMSKGHASHEVYMQYSTNVEGSSQRLI